MADCNKGDLRIATGGAPASDLDIELWVHKMYGFVPHPFWIIHCKKIYLEGDETPRPLRHECPLAKRPMIREALLHFGILPGAKGPATS